MNKETAVEYALSLAKAAIENSTERLPFYPNATSANDTADFIEKLVERLTSMS